MSDLLKLLDGNAADVTAGLAGKSQADLTALREAERNGKTRKSVLEALDAAIGDAGENRSETALGSTAHSAPGAETPARIPPATTFNPSGAPNQVVPDVDPSHPAVDANPRANTSELANRIDFNDPTIPGHEAVERNLRDPAA